MKTPILLLHGALGSKEQFVSLREKLSFEREVFSLDFEGHGKSKSETNFSIELFAENAINFLRENKISKIDIFGYSMGGYVALYLVLKHPDLVGKIITLGTKFDWTPMFAECEIKLLNPEIMEVKVPAFVESLKQLHGTQNWKNVVLKTAKMMRDLGDNPTLKQTDFYKINNETLICLGELDTMSTQTESKNVAKLLPNGSFQEIKNLKHPIEIAPVDTIVAVVNNFMNTNN
ncbi:putative hydrolase or acyltransferase of alpha/beta superfamily [Aequorivita sublithincola DSM 14238]|uniref:Putative hydrolase or acyltransferase of alpha/beta superfamily n=1 Tax=Aequorivita sublithincola (strain DSM 14238 / LMG 21431 / ACAM 643 / 9-3) TaxID=746697 RepID=I3YY52_AEQSU|nr:alpha/beta fold hydrolase [Aequorivita sublithincola]AFL81920.1 putative hydrolase or acyltransferase of alpha/beta superfamily [Aequorivita sublithincola DSM 14238]